MASVVNNSLIVIISGVHVLKEEDELRIYVPLPEDSGKL